MVKAGADDSDSSVGERLDDFDEFVSEELYFVYSDDFGIGGDERQNLLWCVNDEAWDCQSGVRRDGGFFVSVIDSWFERDDSSLSDLCPAQTPDKLLAFSAEHRSTDDFNPSGDCSSGVWSYHVHGVCFFLGRNKGL